MIRIDPITEHDGRWSWGGAVWPSRDHAEGVRRAWLARNQGRRIACVCGCALQLAGDRYAQAETCWQHEGVAA